ncbi:hypothetical protein [Dyella sp.]|uniref:hypothetical protein n=1 Tax=Dyella sp. TaxID=1869338 RepID=UPI003F801577
MTARTETTVLVDAAVVHAEGVLAGLRMACSILGREDQKNIPPQLARLVTEWRANLYHFQWRAEQGTPAEIPHVPV